MSNKISNDYLVQAENDGDWEDVITVSVKDFKMEPDVGFWVSTEQKEELSKYEQKPLRLVLMIVDSKEENIVKYEFKEIRSWTFHKGQVLVLNPNNNYKEYTLSPEKFSL